MINPRTKQRELCYVVNIDRIEPIVGSDNCEAAVVGGWRVMTRKGTFQAGDKAVYFEIDSKVPETETFAFLAPKHYKVKTQKYTFGGKGLMISQGLLMSFEDFGWDINAYEVGDFLTETLGVKYSVVEDNKRKASVDKYKRMAQRHAKLFKTNKLVQWLYARTWGKKLLFLFLGNKRDKKAAFWPSWVVKTDEERVQNLPQLFPPDDTEWFVTEKVDGTSTTFTMKRLKRNKYEFYVCSRNVCFDKPEKEEKLFYETNVYTEMAIKYNAEEVLKNILETHNEFEFVTIQGETYGKSVQQRDYHMDNVDFKAFNLIFGYKDGTTKRLNPREMTEILTNTYNIPCVPILDEHFKLPNSIDEMVAYADGNSVIDGDYREGVVLRTADGVNSFKAVSNYYLTSKYGNN
jgi:hypothetical protein